METFVSKLIDEQLILAANGEQPAASSKGNEQPSPSPVPFEPPVLEKYTDMQDLLLLDPIHEVDDTGWPKRKNQTDNPNKPS